MPSFGGLPNVTSPDPLGYDRQVILGLAVRLVRLLDCWHSSSQSSPCFGSVTLRDETSKGLANLPCPGLNIIRLLHLVYELHARTTQFNLIYLS